MIQFFKNLFKKDKTCFACVIEKHDLKMDFSYKHDCGKEGRTIPLIRKPTENKGWSCKNCGSTTNPKSTMDSSLCDSCWHSVMAATFISTAFL